MKANRPTFIFTGTLNGEPKSTTVTPSAWAKAKAGGSLAGARLVLRITPSTQCFIEESVALVPSLPQSEFGGDGNNPLVESPKADRGRLNDTLCLNH